MRRTERCWMQFTEDDTVAEIEAYEKERGQMLCEGVPVERVVGPSEDDVAEVCVLCGARRPEVQS